MARSADIVESFVLAHLRKSGTGVGQLRPSHTQVKAGLRTQSQLETDLLAICGKIQLQALPVSELLSVRPNHRRGDRYLDGRSLTTAIDALLRL